MDVINFITCRLKLPAFMFSSINTNRVTGLNIPCAFFAVTIPIIIVKIAIGRKIDRTQPTLGNNSGLHGVTREQPPRLRYGQLKEPLNTIVRPKNRGMPFIISSAFEHQTLVQIRKGGYVWLLGYIIGIVFPSVIQILHVS